MKTKRFSTPTKRAPGQALWRSKRLFAIVFGVIAVAVVAINIQAWRAWKPAPMAINLDGTGISPDVAATINDRRGANPSPSITPQNADAYAGLPQDPLQQYPAPFPASLRKKTNK